MEPAEVTEIRDLVFEAARQVFPSCGIPVGDAFEPAEDFKETRQLVAFMGFAGAVLRGTLAVVAPVELMRVAYPLALKDSVHWEFEVFDWSGEVANRLLAGIKNGLAIRGVDIEASTPRVMLADQLHVLRSVRGTVCSTSFASGASWIKVWFDAMAPDNQRVLSPPRAENAAPPAGEVQLF